MPRFRPDRLVVVTGTATEVGKTWVTCRLAATLRASGVVVAARKPVQSFDPSERRPTDAARLASATGERVDVVCPPERSFGVALAPPMAAEVLGRAPFTVADLAGALRWPAGVDIGFVEGAGGVRSPVAIDGDTADLARLVGADVVVVVADAGLGAINAVRLSVAALAGLEVIVFLNRFDAADDLHRRNLAWLRTRDGLDVCADLASLGAAVTPGAPAESGRSGNQAVRRSTT